MRELVWRADEHEMQSWDMVAWMCFWMPRAVKHPPAYEKFHPIRGRIEQLEQKAAMQALDELMDSLPEEMDEDEIFARFEKYKKDRGAKKEVEA